MNVLVDTSVWSLALRRKAKRNPEIVDELTELVREGRVVMTGPVRQELLSGIKADAQFRTLRERLRAFPDLEVDHRKISVAQTKERPPQRAEPEPTVMLLPDPPAGERRLLFHSHQVETERSHRVRHRVEIEWQGDRYTGEATAARASAR